MLAVIAAASLVVAQSPTPAASQLRRRVTLSWKDQELGAALARLNETQRLPIWIDRRVDVSASVNLTADNQPVAEVLDDLAAEQQSAAVVFRGVVYFGPQQTAAALPQLASRARTTIAKLPPATRAKWLASAAWECPRLSQPRLLIERMVGNVGATLENVERLPHDVWPARSLPAMPTVDRVVLLLAGFDLTCKIAADGRRVSLEPIDYESARIASPPQSTRQRAHAKQASARPRGDGKQVFTLTLANQPVGAVIDQLAKQLDLQVDWETGSATKTENARNTLTSCDVHEASLDDLLDAVLTPASLRADRDEKTLTIRQKSTDAD